MLGQAFLYSAFLWGIVGGVAPLALRWLIGT